MATETDQVPGLTTTRAPFIESAQNRGELFIHQPYEQYSEENHESWRNLYARMEDRWHRYANEKFLEGLGSLGLRGDRLPLLDEVNQFLAPLTGFKAKPVSGYVPAYLFFDCLGRREFPTTITIRDVATPDYLPEPDIFHDIAGHVPMHTDRAFADTLVRFGEASKSAVERLAQMQMKGQLSEEALHARVRSNLQALARFFWFTIEFGLMQKTDPATGEPGPLRIYGSGLLSSYGEIKYAAESPEVQRYPLQLEWVINQSFRIDRYQPLLFIVESFDHLFEEVNRLEEWMWEGRLDNVAPGEPDVSREEIEVSLEAAREKL